MTNVTGNPKTVQTNSQIEDKEKLLEQFVVNNPDLEELEDLLAEFNFFEVLNLQKASS